MSRGRRARALAVSLSGALALVGWAPVAPVQAAPMTSAARAEHARPAAASAPSAQTSGDSLFPDVGNAGYDVSHYAIRIAFSARTGRIAARTTITARAAHPLSSFSLDLEGLTVSAVTVDGSPATFQRHGHKLVVTPARPVSDRFVTRVSYGGRPVTHTDPDGSQDGWVPTADGATALDEPVGAMTWYPDNNTPRDKATFAIDVTVPRGLAVASNGDLVRRRAQGSTVTWSWRQRRQMATYLAMVSIGRYDVYHSTMTTTTGRRLPIWTFVSPDLGSLSGSRRLIPQIIRFEERRFGPYPFTSAGIVVKKIDVGYALETQNRPFFDGTPDTLTLVHELAHQWFGDSVTPRDWGDIWLNEGFASYAESLWTAAHGGPSTRAAFQQTYDANPASSSLWHPAPAALSDPADLFSDPVYLRGELTLEALRERIGDPAFFLVLRRWAAREKGRSVSTGDFISLSERVSHQDLHPFFHTWLYRAQKPGGY